MSDRGDPTNRTHADMLYSLYPMRGTFFWIREQKARMFWASFIVIVGCLLLIHVTHAQDLKGTVDYILWNLVLLIQWLIRMVGDLVLFLVSALVSAAKYNSFVRAYPVETGWVLVRDVVNMFFIIVLLVVAFSTIIGYQPLHYKGVLPKLLLMAVLINFSKTLIGILIDFSQVVMLTFVNGFQAAAGGNFINALKVSKITQLNKELIEKQAKIGVPTQDLSNLMIASLLGLVMLLIAASTIAVMVIYLLVRIVGLWVLLILSPIAFFALALPDKMKKSLSAFTDDYWGKLSALLTGGPVVAFFLWLALATAQGKPEELNFWQSQSSQEEGALTGDISKAYEGVGISEAGKPEEMFSFLVAIVLLLTGLSTAQSITNKVAPQALGAARAVSGAALGLTRYAAKKTARGAVRATVAVGAGGARLVERKLGVTERLGKFGLTAGRVPIIGGVLQRAGARLTGISATRRAEYAAGVEKETKHLTPAQKMEYLQGMKGRESGVVFGDAEKAQVLEKQILTLGMSRPGMTMKKDRLENDFYKKNGIDPSKATGAEKKSAKSYADAMARRETAKEYDSAMKMAKGRGDTEWMGKLEEELEKDPSLNSDYTEINRNIGSKDLPEVLRTLKTPAIGDSATAAAVALAAGFVKDGKLLSMAEIKNSDNWKGNRGIAKSKQRADLMDAQLQHWSTPEGAAALKTQLAALSGVEGAAEMAASERYHLVSNPAGGYSALQTGAGGAAVAIGAAAAAAAVTPEMAAVVSEMAAVEIPITDSDITEAETAAKEAPAPMIVPDLDFPAPKVTPGRIRSRMIKENQQELMSVFVRPATPEKDKPALEKHANYIGAILSTDAEKINYEKVGKQAGSLSEVHGFAQAKEYADQMKIDELSNKRATLQSQGTYSEADFQKLTTEIDAVRQRADNLRKIKEKAAEVILNKKTEVKKDASVDEMRDMRSRVGDKNVIHRREQNEIERNTRLSTDEKKRRHDALEEKLTELKKEATALDNQLDWAQIAAEKEQGRT